MTIDASYAKQDGCQYSSDTMTPSPPNATTAADPISLYRVGCGAEGALVHKERVKFRVYARWRFDAYSYVDAAGNTTNVAIEYE